MYKCPECETEMNWSSDEEFNTYILSQFYCKDCHIELNKINYKNELAIKENKL